MFHSASARAPASLQAALRSVGLTADLLSADYDCVSFARDVVEAGALQQDSGFLPLLRAAAE